MKTNKRNHARYLTPANTFVVLGKKPSRVGKVKEISLGGLSLSYVTDQSSLGEPREAEIFMAGNGFHLPEVPCRLVYDTVISPISEKFDMPLVTKKCGLAFGALSQNQVSEIENFINTYHLELY